MLIYIDESGTHKQTGHAITTVVYITITNSENIEQELRKILDDLGLEEFHWADHGWKVRQKFMKQAIKLDFTFKVAIFENPHPGDKMLDIVFNHLITEEDIRTIYIDGEKPKWYERRLKKVLRDRGISIKKLRSVRSKSSLGIQLADALAGLVRYNVDNPEKEDAARLVRKLDRDHKIAAQIKFDAKAIKNLT